MDSIPVVDIGSLLSDPSEADWKSISAQVDQVLASIGFVYLKNHGIAQKLVDDAFEKSLQFYSLRTETKEKYAKQMPKIFGYVSPSREILEPGEKYTAELRESFDINISVNQELCGEDQEPIPESPGFVAALLRLGTACHPLIITLHRILARALQLDDAEFFNKVSKAFTDPTVESFTTFRSIFYPPIQGEVDPGTVRCSPHSDYGTLTLLFQDDIGGLEVLRADAVWVPAVPVPGTILVNTGDLLNFWSGGRYPATIHRVLIPEIEIKKRIWRQSIPYFVHPDHETMVSPLGANANNATNCIPVSAYEHTKKRLESTYKY